MDDVPVMEETLMIPVLASAEVRVDSPRPMPIYEYACLTCGRVTEVIHGMSASGPSTHEGCGGRLEKVPSASGLRHKANDGLTGSSPASLLRFQENSRLTAEATRKPGTGT